VGSSAIGSESAPIIVGQVYRVGIHQKKGSGGNAIVEAFLASGSDPFGTPFGRTATGTWRSAGDRFRFGATTGKMDIVLDNIRLDAASMPLP